MLRNLILTIPVAALMAGCKPAAPSGPEWPAFTKLNGEAALGRVERLIEISPRDAGTEGAAYAAQWIALELRSVGMYPMADTWRERTASGTMQFSNIYADLPGETNTMILIGTHFDTKSGIGPGFKGANDGGSSTGLAIELAKVFKQFGAGKLRHTLRFAFFDGEECRETYRPNDGLHGSRRMAEALLKNIEHQPVAAVIILDMVGDKDLNLVLPRNVTPWLASVALESALATGYSKLRIASGAFIDDHWPFVEKGIPAVNLIDFEYGSSAGRNNYWHTEEDTLDKLSASSLETTGRIVVEMIRRLEEKSTEDTGAP